MSLRVSVVVGQEVVELELGEGATVADALAAAKVGEGVTAGLAAAAVGIWSRRCDPATRLRDGDRVEVYRPLEADPKAMRRQRARLKPSSTRPRSGR